MSAAAYISPAGKELLLGEKDIAEKLLEDYNDVFSDIVNNLVFGGAGVVDERELEPAGTRSISTDAALK